MAASPLAIVALFAFYGLFHALTEGAERALVADLAGEAARGRAFGLFHAVTGAALLPASLMTGFLWQRFGGSVALGTGGALAALAALGLFLLVPEPPPPGPAPPGDGGAELTRRGPRLSFRRLRTTESEAHHGHRRRPRRPGRSISAASFSFVTEDPEWIKKILIGGAFTLACALLVGVPFVLGYFSRTLRNVVAGEPRPMPEWDDLGGIFSEGLRLTAVYLVYTLGIVAILAALGCVACSRRWRSSGARRVDPSEALGVIGGLGIVAVYGLVMLASLAMAVYLPAALARAALRGTVARRLRLAGDPRLHQGEPRQLPARRSSSTCCASFVAPVRRSSCAASGSSRRSSGATWSWP